LFLNGKSLGKKSKKDTAQRGLFWVVPFEAGKISVKGFKNGKAIAGYELITPGEPSALTAICDKKSFRLKNKEVAQIEIFVKDSKGNAVYEATNEITVDINGPAILLGLESGDLASHEDYRSNRRKAFNGRLLAYVQSTGKAGDVKITFSAAGLKQVVTSIKSVK
jgi:beta-galactosidase